MPLLGIGKCNANAPIWEFLGHPMAWDPQESVVEAGDILSMRKRVGPLWSWYRKRGSTASRWAVQSSQTVAWNCL